ncbi:hypothetical protein DFP95_10460 [Cohnella lupini]|jgi:hypothetical protein|uniref:Uncharacterized protein n=1 Tax=Cohnella lupini TaxID=1294267 RepID=A0A3D9IN11_9BACL|nr:hypothetical protein DFP95_10460 [Cohnella lupini]
MEGFVQWLSGHSLTVVLIIGTTYAVWYIIAHRKSLFYKE